jgi:hypothetical protein
LPTQLRIQSSKQHRKKLNEQTLNNCKNNEKLHFVFARGKFTIDNNHEIVVFTSACFWDVSKLQHMIFQ